MKNLNVKTTRKIQVIIFKCWSKGRFFPGTILKSETIKEKTILKNLKTSTLGKGKKNLKTQNYLSQMMKGQSL